MGIPTSFPAMFSKGDNFVSSCLLTLRMKSSQHGIYYLKKHLFRWDQILSFREDPKHMGGNNENDRVASHESVPIRLEARNRAPDIVGSEDNSSLIYPITLRGRWWTPQMTTTISFHLVLSSVAQVELASLSLSIP